MSEPGTFLSRAAFVARFGGVYEHSPWVAERAYDAGPLPSFLSEPGRGPDGELREVSEAHALGEVLAGFVAAASNEEKLALIRAHPDLVGRAALAGDLTAESTDEQASAGLDHCSRDELARFKAANTAYHERFGFPFVLAVRGRNRAAILEVFEQRLQNDSETEFRAALAEIDRIALLRLEAQAAAS